MSLEPVSSLGLLNKYVALWREVQEKKKNLVSGSASQPSSCETTFYQTWCFHKVQWQQMQPLREIVFMLCGSQVAGNMPYWKKTANWECSVHCWQSPALWGKWKFLIINLSLHGTHQQTHLPRINSLLGRKIICQRKKGLLLQPAIQPSNLGLPVSVYRQGKLTAFRNIMLH